MSIITFMFPILFLIVFVFGLRLYLNARRAQRRRLGLASGKSNSVGNTASSGKQARVLAILGSGGHTAEMLNMVSDLISSHKESNDTKKTKAKVIYVTSDEASVRKALASGAEPEEVHRLPRARHVAEPFWHALPRTILCLVQATMLVLRIQPTVVLCNGPATGACVCLAAIALNGLGLLRGRVIYAESVARVDSLSLSGRILYPIVDRFLVQWPSLASQYPMAEYLGRFT